MGNKSLKNKRDEKSLSADSGVSNKNELSRYILTLSSVGVIVIIAGCPPMAGPDRPLTVCFLIYIHCLCGVAPVFFFFPFCCYSFSSFSPEMKGSLLPLNARGRTSTPELLAAGLALSIQSLSPPPPI